MKTIKMTKTMTIKEIRTEATEAGFAPITYDRDNTKYLKRAFCKKCRKDSMLIFSAKEKSNKYHTVRACTCGYRELFGYKVSNNKKTKEGGTKICNRKDCNNFVPQGRKAVCYECQPAPKTSTFAM